ncbi:hypothetical protein [Methylogaea oryzae]|uniref:hypothetical protein n=1 Tax=Methylogaea oryzae TaxID=1295382 RepID=UPI0006D06D18|nr:hypothetical protein [Methylogaea oryzae]
MPPGTLRDLLIRTGTEASVTEERIVDTLRSLKLEPVLKRVGGFDTQQDWDDVLSLSEQQLMRSPACSWPRRALCFWTASGPPWTWTAKPWC